MFVSGGLYPVKRYVECTYGTNPYFVDICFRDDFICYDFMRSDVFTLYNLTLNAPIATKVVYFSRLLFSSAEMFKKPLWQTVCTQIRLLL